VLAPHAKLGQQALGFLERAGVEPRFYLGVQRVNERGRLAQITESRALSSRRSNWA
jgi:hypothetical protein